MCYTGRIGLVALTRGRGGVGGLAGRGGGGVAGLTGAAASVWSCSGGAVANNIVASRQ